MGGAREGSRGAVPGATARAVAAALLVLPLALAPACGGSAGGEDERDRFFVADDAEAYGPYDFELWITQYDTFDFGIFRGHVYRPVVPDGRPDLPGGPFPAVVVSNGIGAGAGMMTWVSEHLASHGYLVLGLSPANPVELDITNWAVGFTRALDVLLEGSADPGSPIAAALDPERMGGLGLSMGGAGLIEAAGSDPRFAAAVALAPGISDLGGFLFADTLEAARSVTIPTQIQVGNEDCFVDAHPPSVLAFTNVTGKGPLHYHDAIPATPRMYLQLDGANHVQFIDEAISSFASPLLSETIAIDCAPRLSPAEQQSVSLRYSVPWLDTYLKGTDAWEDRLYGAGVHDDLAAGTLTDYRVER